MAPHIPDQGIISVPLGVIWHHFTKNGTAFFIFIAGYLFWHLIDRYEYRSYLKTKFKNVISPYLVILTLTLLSIHLLGIVGIHSIDYSRFDYVVSFHDAFQRNGFVWHYIKGGAINYPLWFITTIIIFFMMSPIIKMAGESRYFYFILCISLIISYTTERGGTAVSAFIHFLGFWLLGMFCKQQESYVYKHSRSIAISCIAPSLIFLFFSVKFSDNSILNFHQIQKTFLILFFLSLFMFLDRKGWAIKPLYILAEFSFGIFFVHFYFLIVSTLIAKKFGFEESAFEYFFAYSFALFGSLMVCKFIKALLPKYSRYILGV